MSIVPGVLAAATRIQALTRWILSRSAWIRIRSCSVITVGCIQYEICSRDLSDSQFGSGHATCPTWTYMPGVVSGSRVIFGWIPTPFSTDFQGPKWRVFDAPRYSGGGRPHCPLARAPGDVAFVRRLGHTDFDGDHPTDSGGHHLKNCPSCDPRGASCKLSRCCEASRGKQVLSPPIFSYQFGNIRSRFFRCSGVIGYNHW
jgi:hypothetical protein